MVTVSIDNYVMIKAGISKSKIVDGFCNPGESIKYDNYSFILSLYLYVTIVIYVVSTLWNIRL